MTSKNTQKMKIDYAKLNTAKKKFGSTLDSVNDAIKKTAQLGDASPEQVAEVLTEEVVPALEQTHEIIESIVEALPAVENGEMGLGDPDKGNGNGNDDKGPFGKLGGNDDDDDDDDAIREAAEHDDDDDDKIQKLEEQMAKIVSENITMKKASLVKRLVATYPPNMRKAVEQEEFKDEDVKTEDDLEKLEAKVMAAEKVVKGYHDANLINRSRIPEPNWISHLAKKDESGKLRSAKGSQAIPWQLRV